MFRIKKFFYKIELAILLHKLPWEQKMYRYFQKSHQNEASYLMRKSCKFDDYLGKIKKYMFLKRIPSCLIKLILFYPSDTSKSSRRAILGTFIVRVCAIIRENTVSVF